MALPAGGAPAREGEVRQRRRREPWLAVSGGDLRCAPAQSAPALVALPSGTPLIPVRRWRCASGFRWLQVEVAAAAGRPRRGWIALGAP
ncbi:SH3 domain-containing protein [Synechococcus sp. RSCCF101]|uniref:SH3 domain-containing protein n=1 Tax=Synechococcus sp. RSCCF101 TaxID=2511069 RepID=UPI001CDA2D76|nr:SH3 domain-containing protein [Synechococcus sp. RSCCF101]